MIVFNISHTTQMFSYRVELLFKYRIENRIADTGVNNELVLSTSEMLELKNTSKCRRGEF